MTALTEFDCTYPLLVLGGSGYWKRWDIALGVGEHSLRSRGQLELAQGSRGLHAGWDCLILRLLGTQALLGAIEDLRTESGPPRAGSSPGPKGKRRELRLGSMGRRVLGLLSGWLGLVDTMPGHAERPSAGG